VSDTTKIDESDISLAQESQQKKEKQEKAARKIRLVAGQVGDAWLESIYWNDNPAFLVLRNEQLDISAPIFMEEERDDRIYLPAEAGHVPYRPFSFFGDEWKQVREIASIYESCFSEFSTFVDVQEPSHLHLMCSGVLLSYKQDKVTTVPYFYLVGDRESGKSRALEVMSYLAYRPLFGVSIPAADIYGYLETDSGLGTILEDEAQGIEKDPEKLKIYKSGYRQGAKVPRTVLPPKGKRYIEYYNTYCFKVFAAEKTSYDLPFMDRCLLVHMIQGYPAKDEMKREDVQRLLKIRNQLLLWRLRTYSNSLSAIQVEGLRGRAKELWSPLLTVAARTPSETHLRTLLANHQEIRVETARESLEGRLTKAVASLVVSTRQLQIPFIDIWTYLTNDLEGATIDPRNQNVVMTQNFGRLTKFKVGCRLRDVLKATTMAVRDGRDVKKVAVFDPSTLDRAVKRYYLESDIAPLFVTSVTSAQSISDLFVYEGTTEITHEKLTNTLLQPVTPVTDPQIQDEEEALPRYCSWLEAVDLKKLQELVRARDEALRKLSKGD